MFSGGDVETGRPEHHRWWRILQRWIGPALRLLVVAAVIEYALLPQIAGARRSLHLLSGISPLWLAIGVLAEGLSLLAYARLTQVTLDVRNVPFRQLLRIDLATLAVSHVVPAGSAVGVGLGYQLLTKVGVPPAKALSGKALQTVGSAVVLNLLLAASLLVAIVFYGGNPLYLPIAAAGLVLLVVAGVVSFLLVRNERAVAAVATRSVRRIPKLDPQSVGRLLATLAATLRRLVADPSFLRRSVGWAAANWLLDALSLWAFVRAFNHSLGIVGLLVAYGLANVAAALPITPGGLGVVEGVLVPSLVAFGTPAAVAVLAVIAYRLVSFWVPIPVGFASYARLSYQIRHSHGVDLTRPPAIEPAVGEG
ncbi:MAG: putative heme transporter [Frankiaceae bacterium]|nr:putative heme transporter [Frankiaceae bacterium]